MKNQPCLWVYKQYRHMCTGVVVKEVAMQSHNYVIDKWL